MGERDCMHEAITEMEKSESERHKIGAVIVKNNEIIGRGFKTAKLHAERMAITDAKEKGHSVKDTTLYTTLEPCVNTGKGNIRSCAELIIEEGINSVFIGSYDRNSKIYRKGWKIMHEAKIQLYDFEEDMHNIVMERSENAISVFQEGFGPRNGAKFDYELHGGRFTIKETKDSDVSIETKWTKRGMNEIYAYALHGVRVAKAKYAESFDDIDRIHQFDFESHSVPVAVGEICIFKSDQMAVLIKVEEVKSGPEYGAEETAVKINWKTIEI